MAKPRASSSSALFSDIEQRRRAMGTTCAALWLAWRSRASPNFVCKSARLQHCKSEFRKTSAAPWREIVSPFYKELVSRHSFRGGASNRKQTKSNRPRVLFAELHQLVRKLIRQRPLISMRLLSASNEAVARA